MHFLYADESWRSGEDPEHFLVYGGYRVSEEQVRGLRTALTEMLPAGYSLSFNQAPKGMKPDEFRELKSRVMLVAAEEHRTSAYAAVIIRGIKRHEDEGARRRDMMRYVLYSFHKDLPAGERGFMHYDRADDPKLRALADEILGEGLKHRFTGETIPVPNVSDMLSTRVADSVLCSLAEVVAESLRFTCDALSEAENPAAENAATYLPALHKLAANGRIKLYPREKEVFMPTWHGRYRRLVESAGGELLFDLPDWLSSEAA